MKEFTMDGFVTKGVEVRGTNSGRMVTKFSLNSPTYNRETNSNTPQFFDCEYWWNGQSDYKARNIVEGALLLIRGQLAQDTWQDRNTGQNRSKVTLKVREIGVIRSAQPKAQPAPQQAPQMATAAPQQAVQPATAAPQAVAAPQMAAVPQQMTMQQPVQAAPQQTAQVVDASIYDVDIPF